MKSGFFRPLLSLLVLVSPIAAQAGAPLLEAQTTITGENAMVFGLRVLADGTAYRFTQAPGRAEERLAIGKLDAARVAEIQAAANRLRPEEPVFSEPPCNSTSETVYRVTRSDGQRVKFHVDQLCRSWNHSRVPALIGLTVSLYHFQEFMWQVGAGG